MTVVRKFYPEVRLKKLLATPGGVRAEDALNRAHRGLEDIKEACLSGLDDKIEQVLAASVGEAPDLDRCYKLANEVFAEAGAFALDELSQVAHSLCVLLSVPDRSRVPVAAVKVHVDSMRVLRAPAVAGNAAMRRAVLDELRALAKRFTVAAG